MAAHGPARGIVNQAIVRSDLDRRLLGSFLEHLGRAVYTGVYEPGSKLADAKGFRTDVAELEGLNVPIMRYPGGNFVSGYNWLDGVGPKEKRPTVLERAWNSLETNQFGTNEFIEWCRLVNTEPLLGFNLGTGTPETAVAYVEYCNVDKARNGATCGGSMATSSRTTCATGAWATKWTAPGKWARSGPRYGRKARDTARQMRVLDRTELIACGSSNTILPTYLVWDREVLEECSTSRRALAARLLRQHPGADGNSSAAVPGDEPRHGAADPEIAAVCDYVQGVRSPPRSLWLSFDEWNIWYRARGGDFADGKRSAAPKLLEEVYNLEDALLVGGFLNSLLRRSDRVRVGCLAQIVNVIAPLVTNDRGVLRQTIFYPYAWALQYARGQVMDLRVESDIIPSAATIAARFCTRRSGAVCRRGDDRRGATANPRADAQPRPGIPAGTRGGVAGDLAPTRVLACETITGPDLKAANTFAAPDVVAPRRLDAPAAGPRMAFRLPPRSYTVAHLATN